MEQFEYSILYAKEKISTFKYKTLKGQELIDALNAKGKEGWELVNTFESNSQGTIFQNTFYFKRRIR